MADPRTHSPEFVDKAVKLARLNGWPDAFGVVARTAREVGVHDATLKRWLDDDENRALLSSDNNDTVDIQRTKTKQTLYDDGFIAHAIVLTQANGWPINNKAIGKTSKEINVPQSTLRSWVNESRRSSSAVQATRARRKDELVDLFSSGALQLFSDAMRDRKEMSAYQKVIASGIATDKLVNLTGGQERHVKVEVLHKLEASPSPWALTDGGEVDAKVLELDPVRGFLVQDGVQKVDNED